jgi:hypothetical protein
MPSTSTGKVDDMLDTNNYINDIMNKKLGENIFIP